MDSLKQWWIKNMRIQIWFIIILILTNSILMMKISMSFLMKQHTSTFKNFFKIITELRKVNSITAGPKERKAIMNVPGSK